MTSGAVNGAYSPGEILAMKTELGSWGKVWKLLGLTGKGHSGPSSHSGPNH